MNSIDTIYSKAEGDFIPFTQLYLKNLAQLITTIDSDKISQLLSDILATTRSNNKVIFMGNGGSAATASHFANDLCALKKVGENHISVLSLCDNTPLITAIANDSGFENIFLHQLESLFVPGDLVVAISASGNSTNLIKAIEYSNSRDGKTFGLLGFDGGQLEKICHNSLCIRTSIGDYGPVEDLHLVIDHIISSYLKSRKKDLE
jgi:D-sedoheptulose 7-phosphate isomerase